MKTALIITCIITILFFVFQIYATMSTGKTETQPYTLIKAEKDFEIRYYPSATMALISSSAKSYKELGSSGFTKLAGYIFGGNKDKKQIAMTSPVHMNINDSVSTMSFVMPLGYHKDNLPAPDNSNIVISSSPAEFVAALTFDGFASTEQIKKQTAILEQSLQANHISYYGHFRFLGYNPPYQLLGRRNEIIVAVNWEPK